MKAPVTVFIFPLVPLIVATIVVFLKYWRHQPKNVSKGIAELIATLTPVDESLLRDSTSHFDDDSASTVLAHIGSWEVLLRNCEVLAEIAEEIQTTHPEALLLAEELRQTARAIDWHLNRLRPIVGGRSEQWLNQYCYAVLRLYLRTVDGFLRRCEPMGESLSAQLAANVWS